MTWLFVSIYSIIKTTCEKKLIIVIGGAKWKEPINQKKDKEIKFMVLEKECKLEQEEKY